MQAYVFLSTSLCSHQYTQSHLWPLNLIDWLTYFNQGSLCIYPLNNLKTLLTRIRQIKTENITFPKISYLVNKTIKEWRRYFMTAGHLQVNLNININICNITPHKIKKVLSKAFFQMIHCKHVSKQYAITNTKHPIR